MFNKVHHIGIAVKDMDGAIALYKGAGAKLLGRESSKDGNVDLAMLDLGGDLIEPLSPIRGESEISKFIERHEEGVHHEADVHVTASASPVCVWLSTFCTTTDVGETISRIFFTSSCSWSSCVWTF